MRMTITEAKKIHSAHIARGIMQAMSNDCCQYFAGPGHTLAEFETVMTKLVEAENTQYSYRNTFVALDDDGTVAGICVSYDGKNLHTLRKPFIAAIKSAFGRDYSGIGDETQAGELYLDSLAVDERYRRRGIAGKLLQATKEKAARLGLPAVGLLVDKGNPNAERLYRANGFEYVNDTTWGGHQMRHLQLAAK